MKINELISEQTDLDEGIGSFLGKAAGHVAGAAGAAWRDAKQGYKDAKAVWDPKDPPGTYNNDPAAADPAAAAPQAPAASPAAGTPPTTGTAPAPQQAPAGGTAPAPQASAPTAAPASGAAPQQAPAPADTGAIGSIMQAVDKLDPATKKQLAGELEKSINTPAQWPEGLPKFNSVTGQKFASPEEAEKVTNSPEFKQQMADVAAGKDPGGVQAAQQQSAPTPTTPAPTTPPASTPPPADGKMTAAQQAALKAKLQGQRQAGKTTATQTGGGFKNYVGGSGERMTGVDASGAPVYQKIQREGVEFRSNFLGMMI